MKDNLHATIYHNGQRIQIDLEERRHEPSHRRKPATKKCAECKATVPPFVLQSRKAASRRQQTAERKTPEAGSPTRKARETASKHLVAGAADCLDSKDTTAFPIL